MGVRDGWEDTGVYIIVSEEGKEMEDEIANGEKSDGV